MSENIELSGRFSGQNLHVTATIRLQEREPHTVRWHFEVPPDIEIRGTTRGEIPRVGPHQPHVQTIELDLSRLSSQQREMLKLRQIKFNITVSNSGSKADSDTKTIGQLIEGAQEEQRRMTHPYSSPLT